ncbi:MAG: Rpn family recombination-promoting nuclease/putative transposase [Treponema sp.]
MEDEIRISLTNDYAFKRLLGSEENKPILQDLLQCILDISAEDISGLEFLDKELTKEQMHDKTGVLDVKLKTTDGTVIDIEIQTSWSASFIKRTLFYWAKLYTLDFKSGQSYDKLHKCIAINIIADGFNLNNALHSQYLLQEKEAHTLLTDVLAIHFLDLQAAKNVREEVRNDRADSKRSRLVNWLKFIGTSDKEERAMLATTSPVLQMLNEQLDVMTLSPIERQLYESRMKLKSDIVTISEAQYHAGREEGIQQGKSLGLAEGSRQAKLETARFMKQANCDISFIAQATGLSEKEIACLQS